MNGYWPRWQDTKIQNVLQCTSEELSKDAVADVGLLYSGHKILSLDFHQKTSYKGRITYIRKCHRQVMDSSAIQITVCMYTYTLLVHSELRNKASEAQTSLFLSTVLWKQLQQRDGEDSWGVAAL
ncbi:uncharacterized protein J5F26_006402 isoform 1-T1 [Ciconia maguari]